MLSITSRFACPIALAFIAAALPLMQTTAQGSRSTMAQAAPATPPVDPATKPTQPAKPAQPAKPIQPTKPAKPAQPVKPSKTNPPAVDPTAAPRPIAPTTPTIATQEGALKHNAGALALLAEASNLMCASSLAKAKSWRVELETVRFERDKPTPPTMTEVTWFSRDLFRVHTKTITPPSELDFGCDSAGGWQISAGGLQRIPGNEVSSRGEGFRSLVLFMDPHRFLTAQFAKIDLLPGAVIVDGTPAILITASLPRPGAITLYSEMTIAIDPSSKRIVGHGTNTSLLENFSYWKDWKTEGAPDARYSYPGLTVAHAKGLPTRNEVWKKIAFDTQTAESMEAGAATPPAIAR